MGIGAQKNKNNSQLIRHLSVIIINNNIIVYIIQFFMKL